MKIKSIITSVKPVVSSPHRLWLAVLIYSDGRAPKTVLQRYRVHNNLMLAQSRFWWTLSSRATIPNPYKPGEMVEVVRYDPTAVSERSVCKVTFAGQRIWNGTIIGAWYKIVSRRPISGIATLEQLLATVAGKGVVALGDGLYLKRGTW